MTGFFDIFKKDKRGYSENDRRKMLKEQYYSCADCGKRVNIRTAEADHIHPYSAGGSTDRWNGQMLCHDCHVKKCNSERGVYYGKRKSSWDVFGSSKPKRKKQNNDEWGFGDNSGMDFFGTDKPKRRRKSEDSTFGMDFFGTDKPKRRRKGSSDNFFDF